MNNSFTNITTNLKLKPSKIATKANLECITNTFQNHESVKIINMTNFDSKSSLKFNSESELDLKLPASFQESYQKRWYSSEKNFYVLELKLLVKSSLKKVVFLDDLKLADITPIFKKKDNLNKETFWSVSTILPYLSKLFGRIFYKQIVSFMEKKFLLYVWDFRKIHNTQYWILKMIEN